MAIFARNTQAVYCAKFSSNGLLVSERLPGRTLQQLLDSGENITFFRAKDIFLQVCAGLEYLHSRGIAIGSLSPENLVITESTLGVDIVKIVNFEQQAFTPAQDNLDYLARFMAPEVLLGEVPVPESDFYSAGCIFYSLLVREPPVAFLSGILLSSEKTYSKFKDKNIPEEFKNLIINLTQVNPVNRPSIKTSFSGTVRSWAYQKRLPDIYLSCSAILLFVAGMLTSITNRPALISLLLSSFLAWLACLVAYDIDTFRQKFPQKCEQVLFSMNIVLCTLLLGTFLPNFSQLDLPLFCLALVLLVASASIESFGKFYTDSISRPLAKFLTKPKSGFVIGALFLQSIFPFVATVQFVRAVLIEFYIPTARTNFSLAYFLCLLACSVIAICLFDLVERPSLELSARIKDSVRKTIVVFSFITTCFLLVSSIFGSAMIPVLNYLWKGF